MFLRKKMESTLDRRIDQALLTLSDHPVGSEEYVKTLEMIERLHKLKELNAPKPVSRDTIVTVGANLLGILMIIMYESENVIRSKALGFIIRPRT